MHNARNQHSQVCGGALLPTIRCQAKNPGITANRLAEHIMLRFHLLGALFVLLMTDQGKV